MKDSEFAGSAGMYQANAEANGFSNLPDPTGIRDVWALYASDPSDPTDSGEDLSQIALQADGIGGTPDGDE